MPAAEIGYAIEQLRYKTIKYVQSNNRFHSLIGTGCHIDIFSHMTANYNLKQFHRFSHTIIDLNQRKALHSTYIKRFYIKRKLK